MRYIPLLDIEAIKTILISGIILILLDSIYQQVVNHHSMGIQVAAVQRVSIQPKYIGFILGYVVLAIGLYWFILRTHRSVLEAMLFGLVLYGAHETTNIAMFKKWKYVFALKEILWGTALMGLTTAFTYMALDK